MLIFRQLFLEVCHGKPKIRRSLPAHFRRAVSGRLAAGKEIELESENPFRYPLHHVCRDLFVHGRRADACGDPAVLRTRFL